MEDIQIFDFIVKSSVHNYDVNFIDDFKNHLKNNLLEGDYIIIDNNILNIYKNDLKVLEDFNAFSTIISVSGLGTNTFSST